MVEEREKAIRNLDRLSVSLDQVTGRMAKIQAEQEARLTSLLSAPSVALYEDMAEQGQPRAVRSEIFESTMKFPFEPAPRDHRNR